MPPRERYCCRSGTSRDEVFDLLLSGHVPGERHVELLLDRLEREDPAASGSAAGERR